MSNTTTPDGVKRFAFAAIDPYIASNIVLPTETVNKTRHIVEWGERNAYPDYLMELYNNVPTLRTIVNGIADYACGDAVIGKEIAKGVISGINRENVHRWALDLGIYGGFAIQINRDQNGIPVQALYIDIRYLRSDKDNEEFRYCEKWAKGGRDVLVFPRFTHSASENWRNLTPEERERVSSSIYYVKTTHTQTYPAPMHAAAIKDCEIERGIADYHLNNLENGFVSSMIMNFNNGVPTDKLKEEIERDATEKFCGHQNAGRVMFCFNDDRTHETTFASPRVEDFTEKYDALSKHSTQAIFTAFRAVPAIFGINPENTGFSLTEYQEAFKLYNRTVIRPIQQMIIDALTDVFGEGTIVIKPFTLGDSGVESPAEPTIKSEV